ncbi:MAG: thiamine pyrophosphate-binding protein [Alphaproteobacteria bacterium]|jgi:acetolactate synthase-1/2/3 large subunit|nr:thiamine pyrophosphate-binding protein [Alphaproteobacteria bacterium]MDP6518206.1 thiamine pyrophosphate-binding protein [Alphaproteobacteria bacterium]
MSESMKVGDLVAEFLHRGGVGAAFGVISIHNMPMLDSIGRGNAIRFVPARGEAGAGSMADAYARVTGGLGALITSTGPGAANAAGALVEARFAGSPVLHLTGQSPRAHVDRGRGTVHDAPDQLAMLGAVSKAAYRVRAPEAALGVLTRAAAEALTPPTGPVSVEIPIDVQRATIARPGELDSFTLTVPPPVKPDAAMLDALADRVAGARRPLLWLGSGARHAGAEAERLAALGFGVVTSLAGRGVLAEDHPMTLGGFNNTPLVEKFYESVDLMVVAGSRLRGHETRELHLELPARRCQIDIDPAANGRTYDCDFFLCGDSALALAGLAERLAGRLHPEPGFAGEIADLKAATVAAYRETLGAYDSFAERLRKVMPRDALWVRDITLNHTTWGNRLFPVYGPRDSVYAIGAAIGMGMPHGIGAAIGAGGRKVVAMCGDGGFFLNFSELWTAAQENVDLVLLVMNDGGYGVIKQIQDVFHDGRHYYADFRNPDLEASAAMAGIPHTRVSSAAELDPAVAAALEVPGPALVEVDMAAIGPFPTYFVPAPERPADGR